MTSYKTNEFTAPLINIHKQNYLNIVVDIVNDLKDLLFGGSLKTKKSVLIIQLMHLGLLVPGK